MSDPSRSTVPSFRDIDAAIDSLKNEIRTWPSGSMAFNDLNYALDLLIQARARMSLVLK